MVDPWPVEGQNACAACGRYHGGVIAGQRCLEKHLRTAREDLRAALAELSDLRAARR